MHRHLLLLILLTSYSFGQDIDSSDHTNKDSLSGLSVETPLSIGPLNYRISDSIFRFPGDIGCIIPLPPTQTLILPDFTCSIVLYSPYTEEGALNCIQRKEITLLFSGGFAGTPDLESTEAKNFSAKYKVSLFSRGCLRMEGDDEEGYNKLIFAYLDQLYGTAWRNELPHLPFGLDEKSGVTAEIKLLKEKQITKEQIAARTSAKLLVLKSSNETSPFSISTLIFVFLLLPTFADRVFFWRSNIDAKYSA